MVVPTYGIAETKFVITVAAQKDICPHTSTYPMKAVSMVTKNKITPTFQVSTLL